MNVNAALRRISNKIDQLQIPEDEINEDNAMFAAYVAGMDDSKKLFYNVYLGKTSDHELDIELAKLDSYMDTVN